MSAFCSKCGTALPPAARFCSVCGTVVSGAQPGEYGAYSQPFGRQPFCSALLCSSIDEAFCRTSVRWRVRRFRSNLRVGCEPGKDPDGGWRDIFIPGGRDRIRRLLDRYSRRIE